MRKLNKNKGITLIALVISIIVMLILVAVSITMAVNGELFNYAGKAVGETQNEIDKEKELAEGRIKVGEKWYDSIDDYLNNKPSANQGDGTVTTPDTPKENGKIEIPEGLKVGDYVNYTPSNGTYTVASGKNGSGYTSEQSFETESSLLWRVWSIDEEKGTIELISATQTTSELYLKGADGYNHAVDILNDLCKALYSNENGATARSINVDDINAKTTYKYTTYTDYGTVCTPTNKQYPKIYAKELGSTENGLNETGDLLTGSEGVRNSDGTADYETYTGSSTADTLNATYTYYYYKPESYLNSELGVNTAPTGLINLGTSYWLATRCVNAGSYYAYFNVRVMNSDGIVSGYYLFSSSGITGNPCYACRPVVSLNSNVSLTVDESKTNESVAYWNVNY